MTVKDDALTIITEITQRLRGIETYGGSVCSHLYCGGSGRDNASHEPAKAKGAERVGERH